MEEKITVSAKTLDEAITKALIELQTTSDHLQYEVVQKESSGFLGLIGAKPCIIRARVMSEEEERAIAAAKKAEEKKAAAEKAAAEKAAAEKAAAEKAAAEKAAKAVKNEKAAKAPVEKPAAQKAPKKEEKNFDKPEKREKKETPKKESRRDQAPKKEAAPKAEPVEKKEKPLAKVDEEAVKKAAKEFLQQVFGAMGMEVAIETVYDENERELQVMMNGDDMGILIGKRGQTLDSLQYLVSLVVNKETEGYLRVKLDTENYRERRKETLETLAKNISYKVKRTKHPVSLEPMNPYERRIIHSALQNDRYVVTRSEGEDPYRHVVIALKKESYGGGRRERYGNGGRRDRNRDNRNDRMNEKHAEKNAETVQSAPAAAAAAETEA